MNLILEGCDGVGKTTIAKKLAEKHGCDILHMTRWGPKNFISYLDRYNQNGIISDRSFISECVYSDVFKRHRELTEGQIDTLIGYLRASNFTTVVLNLDTSEIINRLTARNDESFEIVKNVSEISKAYVDFAEKYGIPIIDVTNLTVDEIIEIIEKEILNV